MKKAIVSVLSGVLMLCSSTADAKKIDGLTAVCQTSISGNWKITSYKLEGVTAVGTDEADKMLGKTASFSKFTAYFPGKFCNIKIVNREYDQEPDGSEPLYLDYQCINDVDMPSITFGSSCDEIRASYDGATYILRRLRP